MPAKVNSSKNTFSGVAPAREAYQQRINTHQSRMAKDTYLKKILGSHEYEAIRNSRVLMVGAGGIGCELLKDLLLSGFGEVHIVDLDTITLSNLNRQFLFRQKDIDALKSLTVVKAVESFNYFGAKLVPHHGNVMDTSLFPMLWWGQFDFIFNALDNLEARRYVNGIALFLKKPLMESGTTGYDGQIQPIFPYATECFDCQPKATPKSFPVCTIRSTPSQPVHCIVWAKEFLFQQLFTAGSEKEVTASDLTKETDDANEIKRILLEANELSQLKKLIDSPEFPIKVIVKIYKDDVEKALQLESLWKTREKPSPISFDEAHRDDLSQLLSNQANDALLSDDTRVMSVLENLYIFHRSIQSLQARIQQGETDIAFDKDDEDTLNFVSSAANLRSHVFHIELKSKFDIKEIAGNIIPAIATTNAIISGLLNLASLSFWSSKFDPKNTKTTFLSNKENKRATSALVDGPNPNCASCGLASRGIVEMSSESFDMTLEQFLLAIKEKYGYDDEVSLILGKSKLIYDFDFDDNLQRTLRSIGFTGNSNVLIQDEEDLLENLELMLVDGKEGFTLPDVVLRPKKSATAEPNEDTTMNEPSAIGEAIVVEDEEPATKRRKVDSSFLEIL